MPVCLVFAHPDSSSLSFQIYQELSALLESEGHRVFCQNLYADKFDPVMPLDEIKRRISLDPLVTRYSTEMTESESIVIIHPDWWGGPPAILKGWVDRVFRPGTAYDEIRDYPGDENEFIPLLSQKKAVIIALSHRDVNSRTLSDFWRNTVFGWCGVNDFSLFHLKNIARPDEVDIEEWKRNCLQTITEMLKNQHKKL